MENIINRRVAASDRVIEFGIINPLTPPIALVTTLQTQLTSIVALVREHAAEQATGLGNLRGGTSNRRAVADDLLESMRPINKIIRAMEPDEFPGARQQFRLVYTGGYEGLIALAQSYLDGIAPVKAALIAHGLPANFDEELQGKLAALVSATQLKNQGLSGRARGTAGMAAKSSEAVRLIRRLDAILSVRYKSDPALLAAWKTACHVERPPKRSGGEAPVTSGTPSAPATGTPVPAPTA